MLTPMGSAGFDSALPSPSGDDKGKKKSNPLTDLVETEKVYVDLLTGIIRVRRFLPMYTPTEPELTSAV